MSPPPDVRVTGLSLALAALACGGEAKSRPNDTSQTRPATESGATGGAPAGALLPPVSVPQIASAQPIGLDEQAGQSSCPVGDLAASGTPTAEMAAFGVRHGDFARRTLYSWTTAEQVRELRNNPTLLTRAATAEGEPGRAAEVISSHANSDEVAALLAQPRFENKRFGWSNPWATLQGFGGESYGNHLLRISLREQAWLGSLIVGLDGSLEWAFADVRGNPVAVSDVLGSPERLAAVYFVDLRGAGCGTLNNIGSAFREYFVCNEAMLQSFELYTAEVRAEVDRSISALTGLRQALLDGRCSSVEFCWPDAALAEWGAAGGADPPLGVRYLAALAFPSAEYSPTSANVAGLLRLLGQVPFDAPLLHTYSE
ncbi:MAG: hypothetical protein ABI895_32735 [Deltaproteobacteria bacterium]